MNNKPRWKWSRGKLIKFLMDEGMRSPRKELRNKPTEWLIREAFNEGADELGCPKCRSLFTKDNYECDTGLCANCQDKLSEELDDEVSCPKCGHDFVP
jgi:DNA-directed RNA polymerase subunit RPC12/RpoP